MLLSPEPAGGASGEVLSAAQCAAWRSDGAVFLSELLPPALADGIVEAAAVLTDPERGGPLRFPHMRRIALCNDAALEPRLLRAAAQLLGVEDDQLRLTQSVVNADFAGQSSGAADPGMHRDFEENSLVALPAEPDAVHIILSFDDASQSGGATTFRTAGGAEHTAEHTAGSALLLKMDTLWRQDAVAPPPAGEGEAGPSSAAEAQAALDAAMEAARDQLLGGLTEVMTAHNLPLVRKNACF